MYRVDLFYVYDYFCLGVLTGEKWFSDRLWLCETVASICLTSCFCSLLTIGTISVNRYINICHNPYYSRIFTRTYTIIMAVMLWVVSFALEMPNFVGWGDHVFDRKALGCVWDRTADLSYSIFFSCTAVGLPLFMISTCYVKIFMHVRDSKRKIAAMSKAVAGSKLMKERNESIQLARSLFIIFVVFFVCWTPYALVVSLDPTDKYAATVHLYTMLFAHANSSLNSIVYGVTNKTFRSAYYSILCCRPLKPQTDNTKIVHTANVTETEAI